MNEENKNGIFGEENSLPEKEENTAPVAIEENALDEELENLRETFQEKYDETVEEANSEPVIQELEEGEEEEEPEEEEETEDVHTQTKAPRKKKKVGKIIAIAIPVLLLLTFVGSLAGFFVASIANPNFSTFVSVYAQAGAAEDYETKVNYLEQALKYCSDKDSMLQTAMALAIREEIAVALYEGEGFASAYSYVQANMSEDEIKNPASAEFRKIVSVIDDINDMALDAFSKVYDNLGDAAEVPQYDVLSEGLNVPDDVKETVKEILAAIAEGYIVNRTSDGIEDSLVAMNYYASAYSGLISLGADSDELAEKMCTVLYSKGYVLEAVSFASVAIDPTKTEFSKEFTSFREEISAYAGLDLNVIEIAEALLADGKTEKADAVASLQENEAIDEAKAKVIAEMVVYAFDAIEAENENNLTKAASVYATLTSVLEAFGMDDVTAHIKTAKTIFETGNLSDANTLISTYLTEEMMADATAEQKAEYDRMIAVINALNATSEVFSPYYSEYYSYGTAIDVDALKAEMDKLLEGNEDAYLEGFVNYCLYIAVISTGDTAKGKTYLDTMSTLMPDLPFIYGYSYIADYIEDGNFTAAYNYANKLLAVNVADEYANSIVSLYARVKGDLDAAEEAALKGIEYADSTTGDCAQQLVIVDLLKGDFETAFGYLSGLYSAAQTMESYELVLIFDALYDGDNADITASLEEMVSIVEQTYSYYGITSYLETTAIIDGSKTLRDVFMSGDYTITAE